MHADILKELLNSLMGFYIATTKLFHLVIQQIIIAMTGSQTENLSQLFSIKLLTVLKLYFFCPKKCCSELFVWLNKVIFASYWIWHHLFLLFTFYD